MNSYQNKNEYELLDTSPNSSTMSTRYPSYPLAKNPQISMQNTNYKDWINMCTNNTLIPIEPLDLTWQNALVSVFGIASAVAGLLASPITGGTSIAAGAAIIANILPLTFPANAESVPNKLMDATQELLGPLEEYTRNRANSELLSLSSQLEAFKGLFDYWLANRQNPSATNSVSARFTAIHNNFIGAMALFKIPGYEALLLPVYAQAARLHLLHLRDGITYADEWQLADPTNATYAGDYHYSEFKKYSAQYADHCEVVVNNQLNKIKNTTGKTWKEYNEYRRKMILSVFDIVAEFSTFDPILYKGAINREILTRKIYTDPVNFTPGSSIANDENKYTIYPTPVKELVAITLYTNVASEQYAGFIGNKNRYLSLSGGEPLDGPLIGKSVYENVVAGVPTTESIYEVGVNGYPNDYPRNIGLRWGSLTGFQNYYAGGSTNLGSLTSVSVPPKNNAPINNTNFTHRLSDVILPGNSGSSFAWTHVEINPTGNYLSTNQINLISATKTSSYSNFNFIEGPRFTGGYLIRNASGTSCQSSYPLKLKPGGSSTSFRVRIRYGSNIAGKVYFRFNGKDSSPTSFPSTNFSAAYKYDTFRVVELLSTLQNFTGGELIIIIELDSFNSFFVLERLELIPMTGMPTEYTEPQKLETAQKAVNDLFTN
ncbi:insecticidal delta-endotoxin Cry8Ea1 family protein [Bacillus wiedmannii]|uniref:insecticidal delta-endotoxin Cry8Ea1 family protein n=1 Tax=Bacillus wiedmannii TaxID=1890302 RepID=UPI0021D01F47|nr:insecticidal delta-endotoxin Cry8Ea1 family protein [Bacillus wiedmannii]MCU5601455.1 insecticidal delta-endotoxin Cry8Ea1 family protein [Bacillus wiedmannii]